MNSKDSKDLQTNSINIKTKLQLINILKNFAPELAEISRSSFLDFYQFIKLLIFTQIHENKRNYTLIKIIITPNNKNIKLKILTMSCKNDHKIDDLEDLAADLFEFDDETERQKPKKEKALKKKKVQKEANQH